MFKIVIDDTVSDMSSIHSSKRSQTFRMINLRHNPYVGSFHGNNSHDTNSRSLNNNVLEEFKRNPLVGLFRHAPVSSSVALTACESTLTPGWRSLGLKTILYVDSTKNGPVMLPRPQPQSSASHSFLISLRRIPSRVYSSVGSPSPASSLVAEETDESTKEYLNNASCSICRAPYIDGDELSTLACSHCFHKECTCRWIYHHCLSSHELHSLNCPYCRQDHVALSETCSSAGEGGSPEEGISEMIYLQVGQRLVEDGGYDLLSDFGSDGHSPTEKSASPKRGRQVKLENSGYQSALPQIVDERDYLTCGACCFPDPPCTDSVVEAQSEAEINMLSLSAYSDCGVPFAQARSADVADE